jgi:ATP-binding cassette subfamily F protein 3
MASLHADQLSKAFGIDTIFNNISFEIQSGEKVGLIGPNGAGKTTLMRCLLGLEPLDGGHVRLSPGATVGYVRQQTDAGQATVWEHLEDAYADVLAARRRFQDTERRMAAEKNGDELARLMKAYAADGETANARGTGTTATIRACFGWLRARRDMARRSPHFRRQQTASTRLKAISAKPDFLFLDEPPTPRHRHGRMAGGIPPGLRGSVFHHLPRPLFATTPSAASSTSRAGGSPPTAATTAATSSRRP